MASLQHSTPESYEAPLAFTRADDVSPDAERPGLLRARTLTRDDQQRADSLEVHSCRVVDCASPGAPQPDLIRFGFERVDLAPMTGLQTVLEGVRRAGRVSPDDASAVRRQLAKASFRLVDGSTLRFLTIAPEGFIMRRAGPNGMSLGTSMSEMNDHDAASAVHADQDVKGTPLRQLMRGAAPWLFRHDTPDARNRWSPLLLLNLWIPLQQVTRPLALMDKRTLQRRKHQLRYGLPTDAFLDRDEERRVNDIWTFLHDDAQQWYFTSEMDARQAYVFETLGTPHGSCILPGEEIAECRYRGLADARQALHRGDAAGLCAAASRALDPPLPAVTPPALRRALEAMGAALDKARDAAEALCRGEGAAPWDEAAERAMERVVRQSIEMRVVALRTPRLSRSR